MVWARLGILLWGVRIVVVAVVVFLLEIWKSAREQLSMLNLAFLGQL